MTKPHNLLWKLITLCFIARIIVTAINDNDEFFHRACRCHSSSVECQNFSVVNEFSSCAKQSISSFENITISFTPNEKLIDRALKSISTDDILNIKILSLTNDELQSLPPTSLTLKNLQYLNISYNKFNSLLQVKFGSLLLSLDVSHNSISSIPVSSGITTSYSMIQHLNLAYNDLKTLPKNLFTLLPNLKTLRIENNPWNCSDNIHVLKTIAASDIVQNGSSLKCHSPKHWQGMNFEQAASVNQTQICETCNCATQKRAMVVNCKEMGLSKLPDKLPQHTKVVNLDGNLFTSFELDMSAKEQWKNVIYLHLRNNSIGSIQGLEGANFLENLVYLDLRENKFTEILPHVFGRLQRIDSIYLSGNPWTCDCNTIVFKDWLQENFKKIKDIDDIKCSKSGHERNPDDQLNKPIYRIPSSQLCPQSNNPIEYMDFLSGILALITILILAKLSYDWYWQKRNPGKLPQFFKLNR